MLLIMFDFFRRRVISCLHHDSSSMGSERLVVFKLLYACFSSHGHCLIGFGFIFGHTYTTSSCPMGSIVILVVSYVYCRIFVTYIAFLCI